MQAQGTLHNKRTHLVASFAVMLLASTAWPQILTCQLSSDSAWLGKSVKLDVFIENVSDLRGYETAIQIVRTAGAGTVSVPCPGGVAVDEARSDYVFLGAGEAFGGPDCDQLGYTQALLSGTVSVGATPAYLSDYTLEVSVDATAGSTFEISIDPDLSKLSNNAGSPIPFSVGASCVLTVQCDADADCDDGNECTTDSCNESLVCVNDGTGVTDACDDGDPCTTDDMCEGDQAGTCTGTESDGDGDTVSDGCDNCPDHANTEQADCDDDGIGDVCVIAECTGQAACDDCNANDIPDECDITGGEPDDNQNGVPDVCECLPPDAIGPGPDGTPTSRYLTIVPGNAGAVMAIRVTPGDGNPAAGIESLWVGPPQEYPEEDVSQPDRTFLGAALQCDPHFQDWGTVGVLQVFGAEVVPVTSYDVQAIDDCATSLTDEGNYSTATLIDAGTWGDAVPLFAGPGNPAQPDFNDIAAVVQKFVADPDAPIKAAAQLQPNIVFPGRPIDFKDIANSVVAFLDDPYPFAGACVCPSPVTCEATTCTLDTQCSGGLCVDGFCCDACGRCTQ